MKKHPHIWGAGIAGLVAANVFQTATVFERAERPTDGGNHKALLRFRSAAIGEACGIEFRQVRVHKGLWDDGEYVAPTILHANNYSRKVIGRLADRSVWSLEPVDRWIAPPDFYEQLVERTNGRVRWGVDVESHRREAEVPTISTIPLPALYDILYGTGEAKLVKPEFKRASIEVCRWKIPDADVYQTVYVSDPETSCYRVSITGNLLIAEYIREHEVAHCDTFDPGAPFGIDLRECEPLGAVSQSFGKIAPIEDKWRKNFIFNASHHYGVFSLGRFGTWRNILLDDVLHDCAVIKKMMAEDAYGRSRLEHGA